MSGKLPTKRDSKPEAERRLQREEELELEAFCDAIEFDDISFDDWQSVAESLDLFVELEITSQEAASGTTKPLSFTRTVEQEKDSATIDVAVPAGAADGDKIVLKGSADCLENEQGDLHVTIRVRS